VIAQAFQLGAPLFALMLVEQCEGEGVTGDMVLRDAVPAAMLYYNAGFCAHAFEADFDFGCVPRPEGRLPPTHDESIAGGPDFDGADFEDFSVWELFDQSPRRDTRWGLESEFSGASGSQAQEFIVDPPGADFFGEDFEGLNRGTRNPN
jgi:hypothetical protein